ncbi:PRC-barrel domain-containing protein [Noviherbaspirillum saxi]|nr:PRC-barrel domain-containing protein [Noviherbaspirillum saxi]
MQRIFGDRQPGGQRRLGPPRFKRLSAADSSTADLLSGCAVVSADGEEIGHVDHLVVEAASHQLRYVVLARKEQGAVIALPWNALYFDAAHSRLVFYTLS